jgi:hypothetical protein
MNWGLTAKLDRHFIDLLEIQIRDLLHMIFIYNTAGLYSFIGVVLFFSLNSDTWLIYISLYGEVRSFLFNRIKIAGSQSTWSEHFCFCFCFGFVTIKTKLHLMQHPINFLTRYLYCWIHLMRFNTILVTDVTDRFNYNWDITDRVLNWWWNWNITFNFYWTIFKLLNLFALDLSQVETFEYYLEV